MVTNYLRFPKAYLPLWYINSMHITHIMGRASGFLISYYEGPFNTTMLDINTGKTNFLLPHSQSDATQKKNFAKNKAMLLPDREINFTSN